MNLKMSQQRVQSSPFALPCKMSNNDPIRHSDPNTSAHSFAEDYGGCRRAPQQLPHQEGGNPPAAGVIN